MAHHILHALNSVLPTKQTWRLQVLQQWPTIIGALSNKVKLHKITDTSVVLSVAHPGLAHELLMLSDLIREKINAVIGMDQIQSIHFRTNAKKAPSTGRPMPLRRTRTQARPNLDQREEKMLTVIESDELRDALSSFYRTCKQRSQS